MVTFFMSYLNIEIKARCHDPGKLREYLITHLARFVGIDLQTDTYFNVPKGRLKLRQGPIENTLIFYERDNQPGPKISHFNLVKVSDPDALKQLLENAYGINVIVVKKREIFYIGNVKFHIDELPGLGSFVEIEAGNVIADKSKEELRQQCDFYMNELGIKETDLVAESYSDLLVKMTYPAFTTGV